MKHVIVAAALCAALPLHADDDAVPKPRPIGIGFDSNWLRDLPTGGSLWSLLETADPNAILDRFDAGGFFPGEPGLASIRGVSSLDTSYALGDVDITDPDQGGMPLLLVPLEALDAVTVVSGALPSDGFGSGPRVRMMPRRPGKNWTGALAGGFSGEGLQAGLSGRVAPPLARLGSWRSGSLVASGPLASDRLGVLVAGQITEADRLERASPTRLQSGLRSVLTNAVFTPGNGDEIGALVAFQDVSRPYGGRARFTDPEASESDRFLHAQGTWERPSARGRTLKATAAFQSGCFNAPGDPGIARTVDRLNDGPITELFVPDRSVRRFDLGFRVEPDRGAEGGRQRPVLGIELQRASVTSRPGNPLAPTPETVGGLPARVWATDFRGDQMAASGIRLALHATDRIRLGSRLALEAGLRFEVQRAAASEGGGAIHWNTLSPRLALDWRPIASVPLTLRGSLGQYAGRLPLRLLRFGDPAGLDSSVYRWNDTNRDTVFQASERGPLVARVGPAGGVSSIDPEILAPRTREVSAAIRLDLENGWGIRLTGVHRRQDRLVESVNVGLTQADYFQRLVADPGVDIAGSQDDGLLAIFDRLPSSFGRDRYVLTNPRDHDARQEGVEFDLSKLLGERFQLLLGATASRSTGAGANRGFRANENDTGFVGELFDQPNADSYKHGRLFGDRAYTIKIAGRCRLPRDLRISAVARYQDGQPFARIVLATNLGQGADAVQAVRRGDHRFTYSLTVDARLEKGFRVRQQRIAGVLEAYNLLDIKNEAEEDPVSGPLFRRVTATQPPRALRLGLRLDF